MPLHSSAEWLEADGLGGFASGTVAGPRTRRYHALLMAAQEPPTGRVALVNGLDAFVTTADGRHAITSQRYGGDVTSPDGARRLASFEAEPWPRWRIDLPDGTRLDHELFVPRGIPAVVLSWRLDGPARPVALEVRPFLSGRDYHALHHENADFRFEAEGGEGSLTFKPYSSIPATTALTNGVFTSDAHWYRHFEYVEERARGFEDTEDLASPGVFRFDLEAGEAILILWAHTAGAPILAGRAAAAVAESWRRAETKRRAAFATRLERSGDAYLVRRGQGRSVIAGYPWFADWGRDTFIALRGLCLATSRFSEARDILVEWAGTVSEGMLPNRFSDRPEEAPEFNAVDASLWYVVAVHEFLKAADRVGKVDREAMQRAVLAILDGYARGTRHGIRMDDDDGLLAAGEPGVQLTWMDAKVGDWVVTPRIGKPVEVQALWLNALRVGGDLDARWLAVFERGRRSFEARFWNESTRGLHDVVDDGHRKGVDDASFRPNQIFAVGGLPIAVLEGAKARAMVDTVEERLVVPLGLRTLAREEPGYRPRYEGGVAERDGAYHQGTVWPWLLGPFVEAWVRVRGGSAAVRAEARSRFFEPLVRHLDEAGLGHISEIADGDAPHNPGGCPFQAWSVAEAIRLDRVVLGGAMAPGGRGAASERKRKAPTRTVPQGSNT
ncbi:MAG TPA: amylo-alpha-1,6-glucosidase [Vicinamibacteria bacterium]|nr:amylo-alpha-1,6-glucosidase [Vicinamibacteria bacterium]